MSTRPDVRPVLVTGADGFLGGNICRDLVAHGIPVRALVRNPATSRASLCVGNDAVFRCDLPNEIDPRAFDGSPRAIVHCAYATRAVSVPQARKINVEGTARLEQMAAERGVAQFVFISSLAAHDGALSFYGTSKSDIERTLNPATSTILKPGTILGHGGVFARTRELIRKLPIIPSFYGGRRLQTVWIADMCDAVRHAIEDHTTGVFAVAEAEGVPVPEFYRAIAALEGRRVLVVPFPGDAIVPILKAAEALGLELPISSDNVLGIKSLKNVPVDRDLARLRVRARPFLASLAELSVLDRPRGEAEG